MIERVNLSYFPAEWHLQSAVHLVWPSESSDWKGNYEQVIICYLSIVKAVLGRQKLVLVFPENYPVADYFSDKEQSQMTIFFEQYNDTWVRDYGGISVFKEGRMSLLDFKFNAWGEKFDWRLDNEQTRSLFGKGLFSKNVIYSNQLDFVLEGGAIESNGKGLLMTTKSCLLNPNRNPGLNQKAIDQKLRKVLNVNEVLWLEHGFIIGDDTDGHVDTLVRFVKEDSLVYVKSEKEADPNYHELALMEKELEVLCQKHGLMMTPLPVPDAVYHPVTREKLPATYANFLILNEVILLPVYNCPQDKMAVEILKTCFTDRKIISINCIALIQQGGSLHCATMQYPSSFVN